MADTSVVSSATTNVVQSGLDSTSWRNIIARSSNKSATTPTSQETPPNGMSYLRKSFDRFNLSTEVADFIMESWRKGTKKQYSTYINQWVEFCNQKQVSYDSPEMKDTPQFLMMLVNKGLSYSTVNTARSALSNIITEGECVKFGTHHVVTRFMKAVFETKNPARKCTTTWDVSKVLKYLATLYPNNGISLKCLSIKLVLLMLLLSGQRGQTIHLLNLAGLNIIDDTCVFQLLEHIKTSKPGGRATVLSHTESCCLPSTNFERILAMHKVTPKRRKATVY